MKNANQIHQLLKQAKNNYGQSRSCGYYLISKEKYDQALALLPCETCGGDAEVRLKYTETLGRDFWHSEPCPDCQKKPIDK